MNRLVLIENGFDLVLGTPQAVESVSAERLPTAEKVLRNGQIYVIRGGRTYTLQGQIIQ